MRFSMLCALLFVFTAAADDAARTSGLDSLLQQAKPVLEGVDGATASTPATAVGEILELDVPASVALALKNNPQVAISDESVLQAEARVGQAKAARRPQIKAQAGVTYVDGLESISTSPLLSTIVGIDSIQPDKTIARGTVAVEQVLFAGGSITAAIKASRFLAESEAWKREVTRAQLAFDATQAYHDALLTQSLIEVAKDSIATFEQHQRDAQHVVEAGVASKIVLLRAQTELAARQTDLTSANTAQEIALLNLKRIIGVPEGQPVHLGGGMAWTPETATLDALIEQARGARPELLALDKGIEAAEAGVRAKKGAYLPKAAASAQWQESTGGGTLQPNGFSTTAGLEWEIYGGGKRKHEVAEAESQMRALQKQREDVVRLVELDVRQAYLRAQESVEKIRRDKSTVTLAEEGFRLASVRFNEGVGTQTEMLDAELALNQAKTKLVQALRDYAVANASVAKATGRIVAPLEGADAAK